MEMLAVSTAGAVIPAQAAITNDLYERFLDYLQVSPKTKETYTRALRRLMRYLSDNHITRPQRADLIAFLDQLKDSGLKPTTIQNYLMAAKIFFKWTVQEGLYPNIAERVKGPKIGHEYKKDYLTAGQVKDVLESVKRDALQGQRDYAMLTLMVTCALRDVEVSRANVEDLRPAADQTVLYVQGKGRDDKAQRVNVPQPVEKAIRDYLRARGDVSGDAPLFTSTSNNSRGRRLSTRSISGIIKARLTAAGYKSDRLTAHSLRHTAVTLSILAGKPIDEVQQFARHVNIATTMIYNHALEAARNSCAEAITQAIFL